MRRARVTARADTHTQLLLARHLTRSLRQSPSKDFVKELFQTSFTCGNELGVYTAPPILPHTHALDRPLSRLGSFVRPCYYPIIHGRAVLSRAATLTWFAAAVALVGSAVPLAIQEKCAGVMEVTTQEIGTVSEITTPRPRDQSQRIRPPAYPEGYYYTIYDYSTIYYTLHQYRH